MTTNEVQPEAEAFLEGWVRDNVRPSIDDTVATPRNLTSKCYAEATSRGLDPDHISDAAGGDLEEHIRSALAKVTANLPARSGQAISLPTITPASFVIGAAAIILIATTIKNLTRRPRRG